MLIENLPSDLEGALKESLSAGEDIKIKLKGANKEGLVCTSNRVIILKSGWLTGNPFGIDLLQMSYRIITSADVRMGYVTGFCEVSTSSVQNYEMNERSGRPSQAGAGRNSVGLDSKEQAAKFRQACAFILEQNSLALSPPVMASAISSPPVGNEEDLSSKIERLWKLREAGALTQMEFEVGKAKLLGL